MNQRTPLQLKLKPQSGTSQCLEVHSGLRSTARSSRAGGGCSYTNRVKKLYVFPVWGRYVHGFLAQVILFTLEPICIFSIFVELSLLVYQRPKVWASKCNGRRQTTKNERPRFPIESFCGLARFRTIRPYANYLPPYCQHLLAQSFNCQPVPLARLATRTSPAHPPGPFLPSRARPS